MQNDGEQQEGIEKRWIDQSCLLTHSQLAISHYLGGCRHNRLLSYQSIKLVATACSISANSSLHFLFFV
jgi:hypothetical protein